MQSLTKRKGRSPWAAGLAVCTLVMCGCDENSVATSSHRQPNIILVCMDTVRADHLGAYGYDQHATSPALDRLAAEAVVFENASSTEGWTKPSVASFMTGLYPAQHGVYSGSARRVAGKSTHVLPSAARTLAEELSDAGYVTAAFIHNEHLSRGNGFEQGFSHFEDDLGDARDIRWRAMDWLDDAPGDKPFFIYLHLLDAHYPYPVPDDYASMFADSSDVSLFRGADWRSLRDAINGGDRTLADHELAALKALYDGSIRYIDDQLARLFRTLKTRDMWDHTAVCIVSDHGEEFLEHQRIGHGHGLYENLLHVPWILRVPGRKAGRVDSLVSLVDLYPTLLSVANIDAPESEGVNRLESPRVQEAIFAEHKEGKAYVQAYREGQHKLVRRFAMKNVESKSRKLEEFVTTGVNWQIELDPDDDKPRAESLELRKQPLGAPVEIKGMAGEVTKSTMKLGPITVHFAPDVEFYGEIEASGLVTIPSIEGMAVKAKGDFVEDRFVAERVKVYPQGTQNDLKIRGAINRVKGDVERGKVRIGGLWIRVDRKSDWLVKVDDLGLVQLEREAIIDLLGRSGEDLSAFERSIAYFDLAADPGESTAQLLPLSQESLLSQLDELSKRLSQQRIFDQTDETMLSEQSIQKLRTIGYVE